VQSRNEVLNNLNFDSPINGLDYHPNGLVAAVVLENGQLILLDLENNGQTLATLSAPLLAAFTTIDFSDAAEANHPAYAVSGSADGTLILWDMAIHDLSADEYPDTDSLLAWMAEQRYVISADQ
jgi:WD40 repeat protein